ncbi:hypothetical protein [Kangiella sp. TOML190]|uniref:hypothetical protein n=1 Tax=Kangiella sp. TOML190 TaxID=2931351 RepID=UPI002040666E|nr:hypothetical protein [Kangiella sp. TOML190]
MANSFKKVDDFISEDVSSGVETTYMWTFGGVFGAKKKAENIRNATKSSGVWNWIQRKVGFGAGGAQAAISKMTSNPAKIWGKSADEIAQLFTKAGYKAKVVPLNSGRGSKVMIEGHQINLIKVHGGGGRHHSQRYQMSGNNINVKVVGGNRSSYRGNPNEEWADFIFMRDQQ